MSHQRTAPIDAALDNLEHVFAQWTVMAQWPATRRGQWLSVDLIDQHGGSVYFRDRQSAQDYADRQARLDATVPNRWKNGYGCSPGRYQVAVRHVSHSRWHDPDAMSGPQRRSSRQHAADRTP